MKISRWVILILVAVMLAAIAWLFLDVGSSIRNEPDPTSAEGTAGCVAPCSETPLEP